MIGGVPHGIPVSACTTCGARWFPQRLLCPTCGGADLRRAWETDGVVEETTSLRRVPGRTLAEPVLLATVRLAGGPHVVARLATALAAETAVTVDVDGGAPVARAR